MRGGISLPDPFVLDDTFSTNNFYTVCRSTAGLSIRSPAINSGLKTLVLLCPGQSQMSNIVPTRVVPTNASVIDQLNIYDGALYSTNGSLLGSSNEDATHGSVVFQVADKFVTNGIFNRVIVVGCGVNTSSIALWATGSLSNRLTVAMRRLASIGITPGMTGVTFACWWGQGESDVGTAQATYQTAFGVVKSNLIAAGFSGRIFVCKETYLSGSPNATIQAAQVALVDNTTIWSGGDLDSLTGANRQGDNTHWSDTGAPNAATIVYNAMHASGAPF